MNGIRPSCTPRPMALARNAPLLLVAALLACAEGGSGAGPPPRAPTAFGDCAYVELNQPLSDTLRGTDPQGLALTFSIVDAPRNGAAQLTNPMTGQFVYTPNRDARGTDSFTFRVHNGAVYSAPATFRLVYTPRILPLGDSITEGVTVGGTPNQPPPEERVSYRKRLYERLTGAGYNVDFVGSLVNGTAASIGDPHHEGHPGWCDDNSPFCSVSGGQTVDGNIASILQQNRPDAILLHIGTNHFSVDPTGVDRTLDKISVWAQSNFPVTVFLARIVPTIDGSLDVQTFNDNIQTAASGRPSVSIVVVDQQSALRAAEDPNRANPAYMADNLHPNQAGYERMADRWSEPLTAAALPRCD